MAHEKNTYSSTTLTKSTRFGFKGSAKITGDWSAGFQLEVEDGGLSSNSVNQIDDNNGPLRQHSTSDSCSLRHSYMYLTTRNTARCAGA